MARTRRGLLRAGLGLAASAAAGCASLGGSNVTYPSTTTAPSTAATNTTSTRSSTTAGTTESTTADRSSTETTTADEATTTAVPAANRTLAAETASVVEGVVWFATSYREAVDAYQAAVGRVRAVVGQLRNASDLDENDLRRLESTVEQVATVVRDRLQPYFPGLDGRLADPENAYVENVRKFARRGDWDRTQAELDRMYGFYVGVGQDSYVRDAFPNAPVQGALLARLTADDPPGPVLFELGYPRERFGAFAYAGEDRHPTDEPLGSVDRRRLGDLFDAVGVADGRRRVVYANPAVLPDSFGHRSTDSLRLIPVHVQRFRDDRAADAAVVSVLDGPVVQEGSQRLGPTEWRRVFFYHEGDIVYAYLVRAGEFLVTTGTSTVAWEERDENWTDPLERSWLWNG